MGGENGLLNVGRQMKAGPSVRMQRDLWERAEFAATQETLA